MTAPISNERAGWLRQRLIVVDNCIKLTQAKMYDARGMVSRDVQNALLQFQSERTMIEVELRVLSELGVAP